MDITAVCVPDDGWWVISVPEVNGAHTQAETLDEVPFMAADAAGMLLGVDPGTLRVTVQAAPMPSDVFSQRFVHWSKWSSTLVSRGL